MKQSLRLALASLLISGLLSGCQTTPPSGLTAEQVAVLRDQGFVPGDEGWVLGLSSKVLFDNNLDTINPTGRANIERIGRTLLQVGIDRMYLEGHTDNQGDRDYNQQLSVRRAQSVADVLIGIGMSAAQLKVVGRGMDHPVADNSSAAGRMENRRVAMIVPVD